MKANHLHVIGLLLLKRAWPLLGHFLNRPMKMSPGDVEPGDQLTRQPWMNRSTSASSNKTDPTVHFVSADQTGIGPPRDRPRTDAESRGESPHHCRAYPPLRRSVRGGLLAGRCCALPQRGYRIGGTWPMGRSRGGCRACSGVVPRHRGLPVYGTDGCGAAQPVDAIAVPTTRPKQ